MVDVRSAKCLAITTALCIWFSAATAVSCPAQSPAPQPQVLITGMVKSFEKPFSLKNYQIKVQTGTASKILETAEVLQMTVAMNSTGSGNVTGAKTLPRKEYVYTLYLADDVKVLKGGVEANLADVKAGVRVEITGTVEKHEPQTLIDSYNVVNGRVVMNTVRSTQTQTATSIKILTAAK
jgi:hypothetical protein